MNIFRKVARSGAQTALALMQKCALITITKAASLSSVVFIVDLLHIFKKCSAIFENEVLLMYLAPNHVFAQNPSYWHRNPRKGSTYEENIVNWSAETIRHLAQHI